MTDNKKCKWPRRIGITVLSLILFYTLFGFFGVPLLIRYVGLPKLNESVPGKGDVDAIYFNPYTYRLVLEGFHGYTPDGEEAIGFREARVDFAFTSLFGDNLRFQELYLGEPSLTLVIDENGQLNISGGIDELQSQVEDQLQDQAESGEPFEIPVIEIDHLLVDNASLTGRLENLAQPFERNIRNLSFEMKDIRTSPEVHNPYVFSFNTLVGEEVSVTGDIKLDPLSSDGTVDIDKLKLSDYYKLTNGQIGFDLVGGEMSFAANYAFRPVREPRELFIRDGHFLLEGLELRPRGSDEPFQQMERFEMTGMDILIFRSTVDINRIDMVNCMLKVVRDKEGILSLIRYLVPAERQQEIAEQVAAEQAADTRAEKDFTLGLIADQMDIGLAFASAWQQLQELVEVTWTLRVGELNVENQNLILIDELPAEPVAVTLGEIHLDVSEMVNTGSEPFPFDLSLKVNESGTVAAKGTFTPEPPATEFTYDVQGIDLATFSPYFEASTPATLHSAVLANRGSLKASFPDEQLPSIDVKFNANLTDVAASVGAPLYTEDAPLELSIERIHKRGQLTGTFPTEGIPDVNVLMDVKLDGFGLSRAPLSEKHLAWGSLEVAGIEAATQPMKAEIDTITLTDMVAVLERRSDGSISALDLAPGTKEGGRATTESLKQDIAVVEEQSDAFIEEQDIDISQAVVEKLVIKNGTIKVSDAAVTPNAAFSIENLDTTAGPLRLSPDNVTNFDTSLSLVNGGTGTVAVKGSTRPLDPLAGTQADISIKTIAMPGFSGYAVEAIGSPISSGTFGADLSYDISKDALTGANQLQVGKLRFGKRVPDSKAPNLPLELGVAVLENRSGIIDLNVPVKGNLKDPKFSIGGVISGAFENVFTKVITSPFALMGSVFGSDGEEPPTSVAFAAGSTTLSDSESEVLTLMARAIYDRPSLKLKLVPSIDPVKDVAFLREKLTNEAIQRRMQEKSEDEEDAIEALFKVAYPDGLPAKEDGTAVKVTPSIMKAKLVEVQAVSDADLASLALLRAKQVKVTIDSAQELDASRVEIALPEGGFTRDGSKVSFELGVAK